VIVGEATYSASGSRFAVGVGLGGEDRATCELLHRFFGVGAVRWYPRRKPHYDDEVVYRVQRLRDLVEVIVPFMDAHLPSSHKRLQYEMWRTALIDYWETTAKRKRPCSVEGCAEPARARGRCRHHYYEAFGA
jgi:hypothetical protein